MESTGESHTFRTAATSDRTSAASVPWPGDIYILRTAVTTDRTSEAEGDI